MDYIMYKLDLIAQNKDKFKKGKSAANNKVKDEILKTAKNDQRFADFKNCLDSNCHKAIQTYLKILIKVCKLKEKDNAEYAMHREEFEKALKGKNIDLTEVLAKIKTFVINETKTPSSGNVVKTK